MYMTVTRYEGHAFHDYWGFIARNFRFPRMEVVAGKKDWKDLAQQLQIDHPNHEQESE